MQVKSAIILAAGKGTRMGSIGKLLAKPVWPFFGFSLIELQIKFLKENFGIKKFYINSHHLNEQLTPVASDEVEVIYEPTLLDQGGGILNIIKKFNLWNEPLLVNNADQFYFFKKKDFEEALHKLSSANSVLFGLKVLKEEGYNKLIYEDNLLKEIKKNQNLEGESSFYTYSGMSLIKVAKQNYENEILSFFKSVANFNKDKVMVHEVFDSEYYDFGKLKTYLDLCIETRNIVLSGKSNRVTDLIGVLGQEYCQKFGLDFRRIKPSDLDNLEAVYLDEGTIFFENGIAVEKLTK